MKADAQTTKEVRAVIQKLTDSYENRNLEELTECFAPDADVILYGTGADERRVGPKEIHAQVERDWAQSEKATMSFTWDSVSAAGPVAWAAVEGTFEIRADGQDMTIPARVSLVLEKRDGRWLIVHSHFSTPAASQEEGQSF